MASCLADGQLHAPLLRSLSDNSLGAEGAATLAPALAANGGLTRVDVRSNNIAGDGAEQLSAAVLGNLKIEMFNEIPIKEMRANSITELDLKGKGVGVEGVMVVAGLIPVMGGLTSLDLSNNSLCGMTKYGGTYTAEGITAIAEALRINGALTVTNLLQNQLDAQSAKMLAEVAKQKGLSLCGIWRDQTTAKFSSQDLREGDTILLASDLSQVVVTGALTRVDVRDKKIAADGAMLLSAAVLGNLKIEMFNEIPIKEMRADSFTELDLKGKDVGVVGGMVVAGLIPVMGALTTVSLTGNKLGDEGWGAIFAAICGNKDSKIMSMDASSEDIGPAAVKLIAEALRASVTGALMVTNLLGNKLDAESAKMLAEVAKQKGISLCGIQRDQTTADFSNKNLKPPDAILLESDLSQAGVTGGLTEVRSPAHEPKANFLNICLPICLTDSPNVHDAPS